MSDDRKPEHDPLSPDWPPPGTGRWMAAALALWLALLLGKLYPFRFASAGSGGEGLLSLVDRPGATVLWQVAMFVPLGAIEAQLARRLLGRFSAATLVLVTLDAALLSLIGETLQWWSPDRASSAIDLAANTLGGVLGYLLSLHAYDALTRRP